MCGSCVGLNVSQRTCYLSVYTMCLRKRICVWLASMAIFYSNHEFLLRCIRIDQYRGESDKLAHLWDRRVTSHSRASPHLTEYVSLCVLSLNKFWKLCSFSILIYLFMLRTFRLSIKVLKWRVCCSVRGSFAYVSSTSQICFLYKLSLYCGCCCFTCIYDFYKNEFLSVFLSLLRGSLAKISRIKI